MTGTFKEGEGGVTNGDIDLLFEDVDNELKHNISVWSKARFDLAKLIQRLTNLTEQLEFHHGSVAQTSFGFSQVGENNGGPGPRTGEAVSNNAALASRSQQTASQPAAPVAKKEKECADGLGRASFGSRPTAQTGQSTGASSRPPTKRG